MLAFTPGNGRYHAEDHPIGEGFRPKLGVGSIRGRLRSIGPDKARGWSDMERQELRELVENALAALKPAGQPANHPRGGRGPARRLAGRR